MPKGDGGAYLDVWDVMFKSPWRDLLHQVARLSAEDAERARLVVGEDPVNPPQESQGDSQPGATPRSPRPLLRRTLPPPPGASDDKP